MLERDALGEAHASEVRALIALARCPRCRGRFRVLPCDVLPYKHYSVSVIVHLVGSYTAPGWGVSLREVAWSA